jgi:hypothetical protein
LVHLKLTAATTPRQSLPCESLRLQSSRIGGHTPVYVFIQFCWRYVHSHLESADLGDLDGDLNNSLSPRLFENFEISIE